MKLAILGNGRIRRLAGMTFILGCLYACGHSANGAGEAQVEEENDEAVRLLQGVWIDEDSEGPFLKVKGDSIYFATQVNVPLHFRVKNDTLVTYGAEPVEYPIRELQEHSFRFYTAMGDLLSLRKLENDTLPFGTVVAPRDTLLREVLRKDSVIEFQGNRYRGYAYINSTSIKVVRPVMTEEGIFVDNVYYDNVIHICVYQGTRRLFGKDIRKEMLSEMVPEDFLRSSILSDMEFVGVDSRGYHYLATLCVPDASSCYNVMVDVSTAGELSYQIRLQ